MDTNRVTFSCHVLKKIFLFMIISQQVFCQDLDKSNWKLAADGPNTSQNNLPHSLFNENDKNISPKKSIKNYAALRELQVKLHGPSTDPRLRKVREIEESTEIDFNFLLNIQDCIVKITVGNISEAVEKFKELETVPISDILNITYYTEAKDELEHFKNIIDFAKRQGTRRHDRLAIETIYQLLKSSPLDPFKGVLFLHLIDSSIVKYDLNIKYIYLIVRRGSFKIFRERCVNVMLNGVDDKRLHKFVVKFYDPYVREYISDLVLNSIGDESNLINKFDNILNFVNNYFVSIEDRLQAHYVLYEYLKNQNLLSNRNISDKLGRNVRKFKELSNYSELERQYENAISRLCNLLESCKY